MAMRLLLSLSFCFPLLLSAQCFDPVIELNTQAEVDAFPATYGGCSGLSFKDYIVDGADITSLAPLALLDEVRSLEVKNTGLTSFAGLENLVAVENDLYLRSNLNLTSLSGLSGLFYVGELKLESNNNLVSLQALSSLTTIALNLTITSNFDLLSLAGLENAAAPSNRIEISNNSSLTDISALAGMDMTQINGSPALRITINELLSDCAIASVCDLLDAGGNVDISNNGQGAQPSECLSATQVGDACAPAPTCSDGVLNGDETGVDCGGAVCTPCTGCSSFESITGDFTLGTQADVDDFASLHGSCVSHIIGNLIISAANPNDPLMDLSPLSNLKVVSEELEIAAWGRLQDLSFLDNLESVGDLNIFFLDKSRFNDLPNLVLVDGQMRFTSCLIDTLTGPNSLTDVELLTFGLSTISLINGFNSLQNYSLYTNNISTPNGTPVLQVQGFMAAGNPTELRFGRVEIDGFYNTVTVDRLTFSYTVAASPASFAALTDVTFLDYSYLPGATPPLYPPSFSLGAREPGGIRVIDCDNITTLQALSFASPIANDIRIRSNDNLVELPDFSTLETVIEDVYFSFNNQLADYSGFNSLDSVGDDFTLFSYSHSDLDAFVSLRSVGGELEIFRSNLLIDIDGLSNLQNVGRLSITENESLTSIDGLSGLPPNALSVGSHSITNNENLRVCTSEAVCNGYDAFSLSLYGNHPDCLSDLQNNCSVLPITLLSLTATPTTKSINLHWRTATESQNQGFNVQHSTDGTEWTTLGFISGVGESNVELAYEYVHAQPVPGNNYYRLLQEDYNGTQTTSPIVTINFAAEEEITLFPNPVSNALTLSTSLLGDTTDKFEVNIRDSQGRTILKTNDRTILNVADLPKGVYLLTLTVNQQHITKRFIKQ